jgi:hypothetical protein
VCEEFRHRSWSPSDPINSSSRCIAQDPWSRQYAQFTRQITPSPVPFLPPSHPDSPPYSLHPSLPGFHSLSLPSQPPSVYTDWAWGPGAWGLQTDLPICLTSRHEQRDAGASVYTAQPGYVLVLSLRLSLTIPPSPSPSPSVPSFSPSPPRPLSPRPPSTLPATWTGRVGVAATTTTGAKFRLFPPYSAEFSAPD